MYQQTEPWDTMLRAIQLSYNTRVHSSSGYIPFFLVYGREPGCHFITLPLFLLNLRCLWQGTLAEYATSIYRKLQHVFKFRQRDQEHAHGSKKLNMTKGQIYLIQCGRMVWLNDPAHSRCKLAPRWKGPLHSKTNV